ncbi:R3H and coiled-coil domain-containing protein 1 [Spea bombifrons]|uniref:R3H and coiled-coil domain-containing protein 1 n=1 Tax=Spea bombifrons TaxID=233779 RepID=UPI00234B7DE6|nr:R3H and coiled-coil domain-containing protein 1 [Spea bombifrons]
MHCGQLFIASWQVNGILEEHCVDGLYLSSLENDFYGLVAAELDHFEHVGDRRKVLLFPPVSSRLRFLIHRLTESRKTLSSFSVGEGWQRRTVICHADVRLTLPEGDSVPGTRETNRGQSWWGNSYNKAGRGRANYRQRKNERPDKALYVPWGLNGRRARGRGMSEDIKERKWRREDLEEVGRWGEGRKGSRRGEEKNGKEKSNRLDEGEYRSEFEAGQKVEEEGGPMTARIKCNEMVECSAGGLEAVQTSSCGLENIEGVEEEIKDTEHVKNNEKTLEAEVGNTERQERSELEKTEDTEQVKNESFSAESVESEQVRKCKSGSGESEGQEVDSGIAENRSQSLNVEMKEKLLVEVSSAGSLLDDRMEQIPELDGTGSDIKPSLVGVEKDKSLAATDYASTQTEGSQNTDNKQIVEDQETGLVLTDPLKPDSPYHTLEPRTDVGECLVTTGKPALEMDKSKEENNMTEVTGGGPACYKSPPATENPDNTIELILNEIRTHLSEKDVHIQPLLGDFSEFAEVQTDHGRFGHVIEVYGFSPDLCTDDLMEPFVEYRDQGFRLQWVDKSHALGIFSSPEDAYAASCRTHSAMKFRPLSQGSRQSKIVAHEKADILLPTKDRPQTDVSVAKRLLNRALGLPTQDQRLPAVE